MRCYEGFDAIERGTKPCGERLEAHQCGVEGPHVEGELSLDTLVVRFQFVAELGELLFEFVAACALGAQHLLDGRDLPKQRVGRASRVARSGGTIPRGRERTE